MSWWPTNQGRCCPLLEAGVFGVFLCTGLSRGFDSKREGIAAVAHDQRKVSVFGPPALAAPREGVIFALGCSQSSAPSSGRFSDAKPVLDRDQFDRAASRAVGFEHQTPIVGKADASGLRVAVEPQLLVSMGKALVIEHAAVTVAVAFKRVQSQLGAETLAAAGQQNVDGVGVVPVGAVLGDDGTLELARSSRIISGCVRVGSVCIGV